MFSCSSSSTLRTTLNSTWTRTVARTSKRVAPRARPGALLVLPAGRAASTLASLPAKSRISTVFGALILLGVASTAYGVYEFYGMFTMWPKEVRADLRAGIKAKNQGDLGMSERFLHRALETAQALPLERFGADPYLKLSGIAIALAGVLEEFAKPREAYEVYAAALAQLRAARGLSGQERLRGVALAYKLGEMAEAYSQPPEEEERWLVYAVEELLRVLRDEHAAARVHAGPSAAAADADTQVALAELELPLWVEKTDVVAPLQALGAFYNRVGRQEYAVPLYLSALSVLMPANPKHTTTPENQCRGADLMNSLADSLLIGKPTPERRQQAEAWIKKALAVIEATKASTKDRPEAFEHCELVLAAALFNHGSLREMAGDLDSAKNLYTESRKQSFVLKQRDGILQADTALRRLDRLRRANETDSSINK